MTNQEITYVSIPKGLATNAVRNNGTLKAYSVFYQLKSLYVGGVILDYRKRAKEIASLFGYGERKLRMYISLLKEQGLVSVEGKNNLSLRSSKSLAAEWKVSEKKFWRISVARLPQIETVFRCLALEENLIQQRYRLANTLVSEAITASVGIQNPMSVLQPARFRSLRKAVVCDYERLLQDAQTRHTEEVASLTPVSSSAFPWATLSRQGIATVLNRKSKSTGHKYARKFAALGLIGDENHKIFIGDFSYDEYLAFLSTMVNNDYTYQYTDGKVNKVLPNTITLKTHGLLC